MAKGKAKRVTCEDCFFHQNMLCALNLDEPCTTFRPAERGLAPERQLAFVFRTERTAPAYAFSAAEPGLRASPERTSPPCGLSRRQCASRCSASRPRGRTPEGACSGYLLEDGDTTVAHRLRQRRVLASCASSRDYATSTRWCISHLHADHFLDLVPYSYALTYAPRQQPVPVPPLAGHRQPARPRLIAPPGRAETLPPGRRAPGATRT